MQRTFSSFIILASVLGGCGYQGAHLKSGSDHVYELPYCNKEEDCFKAAEKTCPGGFRVTKYGNIRPEEFVCE